MADPGTAISPFAVIFVAHDRLVPAAFCVDEIYETDSELTTVGAICPRIIKICQEFYPPLENWNFVYDPAAAWFAVDALARFQLPFRPAAKRQGEKEEGLATLNELFVLRRLFFSMRCKDAVWEFDNYYKDDKGRLIKKNDNQIDNMRYFVNAAMFSVEVRDFDKEMVNQRISQVAPRRKRFYSMRDDLQRDRDWKDSILAKYGEE